VNRLLLALLVACVFFRSGLQARPALAEDSYKITPDVVYGHKAGMALTFDLVQPKKPNGAGIMFMVSGGWVSFWMPPETLVGPKAPPAFHFFGDLLNHGFTLFIVRHGSSPQFKVPDAVADVRRAVRFIRLNCPKYDVDPNRLGVCGMSAGGHLSLMLGTASDEGNPKATDEIERSSDRVAAVVAYFAPVDIREWVGKLTDKFPALDFDKKLAESVSPILNVSADDPPTLLIHGDADTLVKLDNSERIRDALKKEHVPVELIVMKGAPHGFAGEQGEQASKALVAWFDKYLAKDAKPAPEKGETKSKERAAASP
jgi:acetyl esterase/lipase